MAVLYQKVALRMLLLSPKGRRQRAAAVRYSQLISNSRGPMASMPDIDPFATRTDFVGRSPTTYMVTIDLGARTVFSVPGWRLRLFSKGFAKALDEQATSDADLDRCTWLTGGVPGVEEALLETFLLWVKLGDGILYNEDVTPERLVLLWHTGWQVQSSIFMDRVIDELAIRLFSTDTPMTIPLITLIYEITIPQLPPPPRPPLVQEYTYNKLRKFAVRLYTMLCSGKEIKSQDVDWPEDFVQDVIELAGDPQSPSLDYTRACTGYFHDEHYVKDNILSHPVPKWASKNAPYHDLDVNSMEQIKLIPARCRLAEIVASGTATKQQLAEFHALFIEPEECFLR